MSTFDTSSFKNWARENDVAHDPPNGENADWPDPEPIRNDLRPVAPLRSEMIPEPFLLALGISPTERNARSISLRLPQS
jgi:hypothetical protein